GAYTTLTPRQSITATPQALFSAAPWVTSGNNIGYQQGNVGIGTANPAVALDVMGYAGPSQGVSSGAQTAGPARGAGLFGKSYVSGSNGVIGEANGAGAYGVWGRSDTGVGVYGQSGTGFGGYFVGNGYFSGNVGIGTLAPAAPLHVQGPAA